MDRFEDFGLDKQLLNAVFSTGYATPTAVQKKLIGPALEGRDIIACAPTGTGKTAAFLIPIIDFIVKNPRPAAGGKVRAIILSPTTELAFQTRDFALKLSDNLNVKITTIVGKSGISAQLQDLRAGCDVVIATPGRAADLVTRKELAASAAEICVIDETDRMTDLGFVGDVSKTVENLSDRCQIMFFSATVNKASAKIAGKASRNPLTIDIKDVINDSVSAKIPENITVNVLFADKDKKRKTLLFLLGELKNCKTVIFADSKAQAEAVCKEITQKKFDAECLHSDKTLTQRSYITEKFSTGRVKILAATDIAARGLDFPDTGAVISLNVPSSATLLAHRVGRTGRMGKEGRAFLLCSRQERLKLYEIMRDTDCKIAAFEYHPFHSDKIQDMNEEEAREAAKSAPKLKGEKSETDIDVFGEKAKESARRKTEEKRKEAQSAAQASLAKKIAKRRAHKKYVEEKYGKKETGKGRQKGLANKMRKV